VLAIPITFISDYSYLSDETIDILEVVSIVLSSLGFLIRGIAVGTTPAGTSGRNLEQQALALNKTGIYSVVRHPLYLGNYLIWIGIVLYTLDFYFVIIVSLLFWIYYERIMFAEERFLEKQYGEEYLQWSVNVPAFIPSFKNYVPASMPFSVKTSLKREDNGVFATVLSFAYVDLLRDLKIYGKPIVSETEIIILCIAAIMFFIIRYLRKRTKFFEIKDRW
jgi:protein-S-isoprenylcysteine O-methyltransferase Ste14